MSAIALEPQNLGTPTEVSHDTLLDLVHEIRRVVDDDGDVVETLLDVLESGSARLTGCELSVLAAVEPRPMAGTAN